MECDLVVQTSVSQKHLSFHNFLEGLIELSESHYNHSYDLLQGNDTLKSAKRRDSKVWEGSKHKISIVLRTHYPPSIHV